MLMGALISVSPWFQETSVHLYVEGTDPNFSAKSSSSDGRILQASKLSTVESSTRNLPRVYKSSGINSIPLGMVYVIEWRPVIEY